METRLARISHKGKNNLLRWLRLGYHSRRIPKLQLTVGVNIYSSCIETAARKLDLYRELAEESLYSRRPLLKTTGVPDGQKALNWKVRAYESLHVDNTIR